MPYIRFNITRCSDWGFYRYAPDDHHVGGVLCLGIVEVYIGYVRSGCDW